MPAEPSRRPCGAARPRPRAAGAGAARGPRRGRRRTPACGTPRATRTAPARRARRTRRRRRPRRIRSAAGTRSNVAGSRSMYSSSIPTVNGAPAPKRWSMTLAAGASSDIRTGSRSPSVRCSTLRVAAAIRATERRRCSVAGGVERAQRLAVVAERGLLLGHQQRELDARRRDRRAAGPGAMSPASAPSRAPAGVPWPAAARGSARRSCSAATTAHAARPPRRDGAARRRELRASGSPAAVSADRR